VNVHVLLYGVRFGTFSTSLPEVLTSLHVINNTLNQLNVNLTYSMVEVSCEATNDMLASLNAEYAVYGNNLTAIVGPVCSADCSMLSLYAAKFSIPVLSVGCTADYLANRTLYPTYLTIDGTYAELFQLLNFTMNAFDWESIGVISTNRFLHTDTMRIYITLFSQSMHVFQYIVPAPVNGDVTALQREFASAMDYLSGHTRS
jgi:hypothetical protein